MRRKGTSKKKVWIGILLGVLILLVLALAGVSSFLVTYAIGRSGGGANRTASLDVESAATDTEKQIAANKEKQSVLTEDFKSRAIENHTSITSDDGLELTAGYYTQDNSHDWAVIIHGYRSNHETMIDYAQRYYDAGYQVLMPDLRACGDSEGNFVGMGWLDKGDILLWIDWILDTDADAQIVLHGVSMGAATVIMTSGEETPDAVRVFIEDCGYTSVWDIFSSELQLRFHLPEFPVLYSASAVSKIRAGYSFTEASALEQIKKCEKPMLFIHGTEDDFVPFEMLDILYQAKPGENKDTLIAEGAGHAQSRAVLGETYWKTVFAFISDWK